VPVSKSYPLLATAWNRGGSPTAWAFALWRNQREATSSYIQLVARWKKNFNRLYARRVLELAAASAATQRFISHLDAAAIEKPERWLNWQAKDWEETALSSVGESRLRRVWMATSRMATLALIASPMAVLYPLSLVSNTAKDVAWSYALFGIEKAGPTWIKLVQWATTRQDLFSPEFCKYFGKLRDDTEGHPWKDTERILKEELGAAVNAIELDPNPIGSGCVAQVYRGTLKQATPTYPAGTKLAIKVQHPGIWQMVS
jgi:ABC1 atypical kinase-like domain